MAEEGEPTDKETSKYNEAAMQIMRLHNLWVKIEEKLQCEKEGVDILTDYKFLLDGVSRELSADIERIKKQNLNQGKKIELQNAILRKRIANAENDDEKYDILNERHEFLKKLQDKAGKGGIYEGERDKDYE